MLPGPRGAGGGTAAPKSLSMSQISPRRVVGGRVSIAQGGRCTVLKADAGKREGKVVRGDRGEITQFSYASKRAFTILLQSIDRERAPAEEWGFVTLTYGQEHPTPRAAKRDLDRWLKWLHRTYPAAAAFWKLEPQKRAAPHFHLLVWFGGKVPGDVAAIAAAAWVKSTKAKGTEAAKMLRVHLGKAKGSRPCVEPLKTWDGVTAYGAKYVAKKVDAAGWESPGRFWGVMNRKALPVQRDEVDIEGRAWKIYRRQLRRWQEHQPSGMAYIRGKSYRRGLWDGQGEDTRRRVHMPGQVVDLRGMIQVDRCSGGYERCKAREFWTHYFEDRIRERKRRVSGGGNLGSVTYISEAGARRLLDFALREGCG